MLTKTVQNKQVSIGTKPIKNQDFQNCNKTVFQNYLIQYSRIAKVWRNYKKNPKNGRQQQPAREQKVKENSEDQ